MEGVTSSVQLNKLEKMQLYAESEVLRTYHALSGGGKHRLKGRGSKFKKRAEKHDYHSLTYLLRNTWGVKSGRIFLSQMRKELVGDVLNRGVDIATSNIYISFGEEEEEKDVRIVIDDFDLAANVFTAKYL